MLLQRVWKHEGKKSTCLHLLMILLGGVFCAIKRLRGLWRVGGAARAIARDTAECAALRARGTNRLPAVAVPLTILRGEINRYVRKVGPECYLRRKSDENFFISKGTHE